MSDLPISNIKVPDNFRIDGWQSNQFIMTAFDDSLTIDMRLRALANLVQQSVVTVNQVVDWINDMGPNLMSQAENILNGWLNDGTLENILCTVAQNLLATIQAQVNTNTSNISTNTTNISTNTTNIQNLQNQFDNLTFPNSSDYMFDAKAMYVYRWDDIPSDDQLLWNSQGWATSSTGHVDSMTATQVLNWFNAQAGTATNNIIQRTYGSVGGFNLNWYIRYSDALQGAINRDNAQTTASGTTSMLQVTDSFVHSNMPRILIFTASIHGNEKSSTVAFMQWFNDFLYSDDPFFKMMRNTYTVAVLPMINPVGWNATVRHDVVTPNNGGTNGIDLNREFNSSGMWRQIDTNASTAFATINSRFVRDVIAGIQNGSLLPPAFTRWATNTNYLQQGIRLIDIHNFRIPSLNSDNRHTWVGTNMRAFTNKAIALSEFIMNEITPIYTQAGIANPSNARAPITAIGAMMIQREANARGIPSMLVEVPRLGNEAIGTNTGANTATSCKAGLVIVYNTVSMVLNTYDMLTSAMYRRPVEIGVTPTDTIWSMATKVPPSVETSIEMVMSVGDAGTATARMMAGVANTLPTTTAGSTISGFLRIWRNSLRGSFGQRTIIELYNGAFASQPYFRTTTTGTGSPRSWISMAGTVVTAGGDFAPLDTAITYDDTDETPVIDTAQELDEVQYGNDTYTNYTEDTTVMLISQPEEYLE